MTVITGMQSNNLSYLFFFLKSFILFFFFEGETEYFNRLWVVNLFCKITDKYQRTLKLYHKEDKPKS